MRGMITLRAHGVQAALAVHPISKAEYRTYLHESGQPVPPVLAKPDAPSAPATYVSQKEAVAYCHWLSTQEGRAYRLPGMAELSELASEVTLEGISTEIWPHYHDARSESRWGMKEVYLCEWTQETESVPQYGTGGQPRVLGSVFYPPWLRQGPNATHAQAHLLATEGYSFVTFRVASDA